MSAQPETCVSELELPTPLRLQRRSSRRFPGPGLLQHDFTRSLHSQLLSEDMVPGALATGHTPAGFEPGQSDSRSQEGAPVTRLTFSTEPGMTGDRAELCWVGSVQRTLFKHLKAHGV